jgi:hypothetical protein
MDRTSSTIRRTMRWQPPHTVAECRDSSRNNSSFFLFSSPRQAGTLDLPSPVLDF